MNKPSHHQLTIQAASEISGYSENWLRILINKEKPFAAYKPYGPQKGWRICTSSFLDWLQKRKQEKGAY